MEPIHGIDILILGLYTEIERKLNEFTKFFASQPFFWILLVWSLVWKMIALWKAAGRRQLVWFIILFVVNTSGILEIAYIFWLSKYPLDKDQVFLKWLNENIGRKIKSA